MKLERMEQLVLVVVTVVAIAVVVLDVLMWRP